MKHLALIFVDDEWLLEILIMPFVSAPRDMFGPYEQIVMRPAELMPIV